MEVDRHLASLDHNDIISRYVNDSKTSSSPLRYVSGFVEVTLLQGYIAINGYSLSVGECVSIKSPPWTPAAVMELSNGSRFQPGNVDAKKEKNSKRLKKIKNFVDQFVNNDELKALLSNDNNLESMFINKNDDSSTPTIVMYHGIPPDEQEWMVAAEELNSKYKIQFDRMKQRSCGDCNYFESSCVCVGSGLIGDTISMQQSSLDITVIPVTWSNTAITLFEDVKSGVELYVESNKRESEPFPRIPDNIEFPTALCRTFMLCGAKGVGKSTAVKYIINTLLSKSGCMHPISAVAVLDCDVGQPEFNVPGTLSLNLVTTPVISPPHLHLQDYPPVESYFLGELTTKLTPERFSAAVQQLMRRYEELRLNTWNKALKLRKNKKGSGSSSIPISQSLNKFDVLSCPKSFVDDIAGDVPLPCDGMLPLLINCDGNIRFMGNEILSAIVNICQPTDVLHISTDKDRVIPAIHQSEEMFNHYHSEQQVYKQSQERLVALEQQLEQGHVMEVEESESDWGTTMSATFDTSVSAAAAYEALNKQQNVMSSSLSAAKKKKKQSTLLKKQIEELRNTMARISNTVIYPYSIYSLQPGRVTQSKVAAVDLRNLRLVSYFLRENKNIKSTMMELFEKKVKAATTETDATVSYSPVVVIKNGNLVDSEGVIAVELLKISPISFNLTGIALRSAVSDIPLRLMLAAINVSLVGLLFPCASTTVQLSRNLIYMPKSHTFSISKQISDITNSQSSFAMDCSAEFILEPCIGVGIVRDVVIGEGDGNIIVTTCESVKNRLLSFLESNQYKPVVLMGCNIPLPSTLLYTTDFYSEDTSMPSYPYYSSESHGEGANAMKHRNNVKRKRML